MSIFEQKNDQGESVDIMGKLESKLKDELQEDKTVINTSLNTVGSGNKELARLKGLDKFHRGNFGPMLDMFPLGATESGRAMIREMQEYNEDLIKTIEKLEKEGLPTLEKQSREKVQERINDSIGDLRMLEALVASARERTENFGQKYREAFDPQI